MAAAPSLDEASLAVSVDRAGARGAPVTVAVRYTSAVRVPFVDWLFGSSVGMAATTTARQEFG